MNIKTSVIVSPYKPEKYDLPLPKIQTLESRRQSKLNHLDSAKLAHIIDNYVEWPPMPTYDVGMTMNIKAPKFSGLTYNEEMNCVCLDIANFFMPPDFAERIEWEIADDTLLSAAHQMLVDYQNQYEAKRGLTFRSLLTKLCVG